MGYQVRFEEVAGKHAPSFSYGRHSYPTLDFRSRLAGVDIVVLDEFHERHLEADLALALLRNLQRRRSAGT